MGFIPSKDRRSKSNSKKVAILVGVMVVLLVLVAINICLPIFVRNHETPVYKLAYQFGDTDEYIVPSEYHYGEESPETYFKDGLSAYAVDGDTKAAYKLFQKAEEHLNAYSDEALPFYLYCYLNQCVVDTDGAGSSEYVDKAVEASFDYLPAVNDHYHFWQAIYSIAEDEASDQIAKDYMERALALGDSLTDEARIRYNNCIAMLDFFDGNYSKSLRRFYDVREMYNQVKDLNAFIKNQRFFTNSYVAILYYEFEDYDSAIQILQDNIALDGKDNAVNADRKFSDYINLSNAYIETGDGKNAIKALDEMWTIVPGISEDIRESVVAAACGNYAWAYTMEGNLEKAEEYIDQGRGHLERMESDAFYGGPLFIDLTEARLLTAKKEYDRAIELLEEIRDSGEMEYAGLEKDVYKLLIDLYDEMGDKENYYDTRDKLRTYEDKFYQTIKREYLEFSAYYEKSERLSKENRMLRFQKRTIEIVILLIVLALASAITIIFIIRHNDSIDPLTGVRNRKALHHYSKKVAEKGVPAGTCFIMLDIDYFKKYNDTYGHLMGDEALKKVAGTIKDSLRKKDFIIRFGGEEFLIILENIDEAYAEKIGNRILENVKDIGIKAESSPVASVVTVSLGLCLCTATGIDIDVLLTEADTALYAAKESGRNCMRIYTKGDTL